jgi:hypothetical protein
VNTDRTQGTHCYAIPQREANQRSDLAGRQSQAGKKTADLHAACAAGVDHGARQCIGSRVDNDAHRDERQVARGGNFGDSRTLHVDRSGSGSAKGRGFVRGIVNRASAGKQIAVRHRTHGPYSGSNAFAPRSGCDEVRTVCRNQFAGQKDASCLECGVKATGHSEGHERSNSAFEQCARGGFSRNAPNTADCQ